MGIGFFRVLLSFTVIIAHTGPVFGVPIGDANVAVRSFFIISGFYMAFILNGKYSSYFVFITNRFLRIYPVYLTVLALTVVTGSLAYVLKGNWGELQYLVDYIGNLRASTILILLISNILILGRDLVMFTVFNPATGLLTFADNVQDGVQGLSFLLVPQAWTLALELLFYFIAPFVVTKKARYVIAMLVLSIGLKVLLRQAGLTSVTWTFRFFPAEFCYFVAGVLSYKLYECLKPTKLNRACGLGATIIIIAIHSSFSFIPTWFHIDYYTLEWFFYGVLTMTLPFIFIYSKNLKFDRKIAELSYPIYISHILVNNVTNPLFYGRLFSNRDFQAISVLIFSVLFSLLLVRFIQQPVDRFRANRVQKQSPLRSSLAVAIS